MRKFRQFLSTFVILTLVAAGTEVKANLVINITAPTQDQVFTYSPTGSISVNANVTYTPPDNLYAANFLMSWQPTPPPGNWDSFTTVFDNGNGGGVVQGSILMPTSVPKNAMTQYTVTVQVFTNSGVKYTSQQTFYIKRGAN